MNFLEETTCNFCNSDCFEVLFSGMDRRSKNVPSGVWCRIVKCSNCGMVYLNPRVKENLIGCWYPKSEYYTKLQSYNNNFLRRFKDSLYFQAAVDCLKYPPGKTDNHCGVQIITPFVFRLLKTKFRRLLTYQSQGRVLDFGFGSGFSLRRLQNLGWECWGVDRDVEDAQYMVNEGIKIFDDLWDEGIPANYFDYVTTYHVIEHLYDPKSTLKRLFEVLKPGGRLIMEVPNFNSFAARIFRTYWDNLGIPIHNHFFTPNTAEMYLANVGLKDISISYFSLPQSILGSIQYVLNDLISKLTGREFHSLFLRNSRFFQLCVFPIVASLNLLKLGDSTELQAIK